ncbi:MAG TPA: hypothetical protein PKH37_08155 [Alphaproteobacteria bacterium]|nr:hypothetical protein [Alphaproteobacteria bacterium]
MSHTAQGYVIPRKSTYTSLEKATLFSEVFSTSRPESTQFMLFGRIAPDWILRYPLSLTIVPYDLGGYLVSDERVCVYGMGETKSEALDEYKSMLVDLFEELRSSEKVLSPRLLEQLKHLRSIIKRG